MTNRKYNGKDWGRIIKSVRVLRAHGIREASKKAGISPATLSRIENGKEPDVNSLFAIAKYLGVKMEKLFYKP
jgi:transcriptional regulator with XRE-family HTH domain